MGIEERELTKAEFYTLLESCPEEESDSLINYARSLNTLPWEYFQNLGITSYGILIDGVPIYYACLYSGEDDTYRLWTLRKKEIKEQFTLFKLCKRKVQQTAKVYSPIYAVNYVKNRVEAKWNMHMGFIPYKIDGDLVYYRMDNHKGA